MARAAVAAALLAVLLGAVVASAAGRPAADALTPTAVVLGTVVCFAAGTLLPRRVAAWYGATVSTGVAVAVLLAPDGLSGGPLAGPLGYGNANGALCAQGAAAAAVALHASGRRALRAYALLAGSVSCVLALETRSAVGFLTAVAVTSGAVLLALVRASRRRRAARALVLVTAATAAAVVAATVALAVAYAPEAPRTSSVERLVDRSLSERRVVLWSESLDLLRQAPWRGVGASRFADTSPTALRDGDAAWAHSTFLQLGAESGAFALAALVGLLAALFAHLTRAASTSAVGAVAALAAGAFTVHAAVDYVAHFPVVPLLAAATVGVAGGRGTRGRDGPETRS